MESIENQMRETKGKIVRLKCTDGKEYTGLNLIFTEGYDNDNGECDIILRLKNRRQLGLYESEIMSLEVVEP